MANSRQDIENWIAKTAMGDRAAFNQLYDATCAKLLGVSLRILKDRAAAEDAMQDSYVKIWKNADRYSANGLSPMTWLITIARNTSIDRLRAGKNMTELGDVYDRIPCDARGPEELAVARSEAERIISCMGELEPKRRDAIEGAYFGGKSYADLADQFEIPLNTMRTWLRRGLQSLRDCMAR